MTPDHPLRWKVKALAEACNVTPQAVGKWARKGEVPPEYLAIAVRITGASPRLLAPALFRYMDETYTEWANRREME